MKGGSGGGDGFRGSARQHGGEEEDWQICYWGLRCSEK